MLPSKYMLIPALTIFHRNVAAAFTTPNPRAAVAQFHSRDFSAVKRQIRNADYASGPPSNAMAGSDPPAVTSTSPTSHPSDTPIPKKNSKTSRSLELEEHRHYGSPPNYDQSRGAAPSTRQEPQWRRWAHFDAFRRISRDAYTGADKTQAESDHIAHTQKVDRQWWRKRQELTYRELPDPNVKHDNLDVIARGPKESHIQWWRRESAVADISPADPSYRRGFFRRFPNADFRESRMHNVSKHRSEAKSEANRERLSTPVIRWNPRDVNAMNSWNKLARAEVVD